MKPPVLCLSTLLALLARSPAQSTLIVGPGGFPDFSLAYTAARPGDTIRIRLAQMPPLTLRGEPVSIIGEASPPTSTPCSPAAPP